MATYYQIAWTVKGETRSQVSISSSSAEEVKSAFISDYLRDVTVEAIDITEVEESSLPRVRAFRFVDEREDGTTDDSETITSFRHQNPTRAQMIAEYNAHRSLYGQSYGEALLSGSTLYAQWGTVIDRELCAYGTTLPLSFIPTRKHKLAGTDAAVAKRRAKLATAKAEREANKKRIADATAALKGMIPEGSTVHVEDYGSRKGHTRYARFYFDGTEITGLVADATDRGMYNRATKEQKEAGIMCWAIEHGTVGQLAHILYGNGRKLVEARN